MTSVRIAIALIVVAAGYAAARGQEVQGGAGGILKPDLGGVAGTCKICGMDVYEEMLTRMDIASDDSVYRACGFGCAAVLMQGREVRSIRVVDFVTGSMTGAGESYFVVASNVVPARAMLPVLSFRNKGDAVSFVKVHGGRILEFTEMADLGARIHSERMNREIPPARH